MHHRCEAAASSFSVLHAEIASRSLPAGGVAADNVKNSSINATVLHETDKRGVTRVAAPCKNRHHNDQQANAALEHGGSWPRCLTPHLEHTQMRRGRLVLLRPGHLRAQ